MLRQPRECLTADKLFPRDMSRRRGIFQHTHVGEVFPGESRIGAQATNSEVGESETLYLRYVDSGIEVKEIGGRTVGLVADDDPMTMSPCRPLEGEILIEHVGQRLTIVANHLRIAVEELVEVVEKTVSAPFLKLIGQRRCPVCAVNLIAVVEERRGIRCATGRKSRVNMGQIVLDGILVEVVDDPSFAARSRPFHLLPGATDEECYNPLLAFFACGECPHGRQPTVRALFLRHGKVYSAHFYRLADDSIDKDGLTSALTQRHPRTAEGPSGAVVHIDLHGVAGSDLLRNPQGMHPLGRQIFQFVAFIALHTIYWGYLNGTDTVTVQLVEVPLEVHRVDSRP